MADFRRGIEYKGQERGSSCDLGEKKERRRKYSTVQKRMASNEAMMNGVYTRSKIKHRSIETAFL